MLASCLLFALYRSWFCVFKHVPLTSLPLPPLQSLSSASRSLYEVASDPVLTTKPWKRQMVALLSPQSSSLVVLLRYCDLWNCTLDNSTGGKLSDLWLGCFRAWSFANLASHDNNLLPCGLRLVRRPILLAKKESSIQLGYCITDVGFVRN